MTKFEPLEAGFTRLRATQHRPYAPLPAALMTPARLRMSGRSLARSMALSDSVILFATSLVLAGLAVGGQGVTLNRLALIPLLLAPLMAGFTMRAFRTYAFETPTAPWRGLGRIGAALLVGAGMAWAPWIWFGRTVLAPLAPWVLLNFLILASTYLWRSRKVARARRDKLLNPNVVIVGATSTAQHLIEKARASDTINVLGVFEPRRRRAPSAIDGAPVLGDIDALLQSDILPYVDRVIIALPSEATGRVAALVERLKILPHPLTLYVDAKTKTDQEAFSQLAVTPLDLHGIPLAETEGAIVKRGLDVVLASIALVLLGPVMALIALRIKFDSHGPIFFRQKRFGFNNEVITVLKFRTMRIEVCDAFAHRQVSSDDPRVTRFGRFLRRTSLDELPQLINVLRGDMSLVGPRPHAVTMHSSGQETARMTKQYAWRHRVKPGITGWAQINGSRGPVETEAAVRRRVELDLAYIRRQSLALDLYILVMTVPRLLGDRQAIR